MTEQLTTRAYAGSDQWEPVAILPRLRTQLAFWAQTLDPLPPRPSLPYDFPRPPVAGTAGGRRAVTLSPAARSALLRTARGRGTNAPMVALAAVNVLVHRYSGESDIALGVPVVTRNGLGHSGVDEFVNMVVVRTDLAGEPDFAEVLRRTVRSANSAFANQDVPFGEIVTQIRPPRNGSRTAVVDVVCAYRRSARGAGASPTGDLASGSTRHDLVFEFTEGADDIALEVTYRADLFRAETVDRMVGHVQNLLIAIGTEGDAQAPVAELELLTSAERDLILNDWSHGDDLVLPFRSIADVVADNAERFADRVAVTSSSGELTYGELDRRAGALSARLTRAGVRAEDRVVVSVERGIDQIVALLAVLRSGGAIVPVDPDWPARRRTAVIDITAAAVMIADPDKVAEISAERGIPVLSPATTGDGVDAREDEPVQRVDAGATACVVFTSGSTGEPKGVLIGHGALSFRMRWHARLLRLGVDDAVLYKAPLSVDISLNEIFLSLVAGCRLVVADAGRDGNVDYLLATIRRERVTFCYVVASVLHLMLDRTGFDEATRGLRHLWCGGEPMTTELYRRFRERSDATLYNGYGPAETTVGVTHRAYPADEPFTGVSIGRPNSNSRVYVLDSLGNPLPIGVIGEIHIGGVQLSRGYLKRPAETADRFIPNAFSPEMSSRLYRTGDLARFTSAGELEFIGRADTQVKIRGFRIEIGEIEAVLSLHPDLRQSAVLVRSDSDGDRRLVCYAVPLAETEPDVEAIGRWLRERLPDYMVPAWIDIVERLPLSPAGKIDRGELNRWASAAAHPVGPSVGGSR